MKDRLTVGELLAALQGRDHGAEVQVWLPGSRIYLTGVMPPAKDGGVLVEGNVMPGSALDDFTTQPVREAFRAGKDTRGMR